jgi:hypothetical protein
MMVIIYVTLEDKGVKGVKELSLPSVAEELTPE